MLSVSHSVLSENTWLLFSLLAEIFLYLISTLSSHFPFIEFFVVFFKEKLFGFLSYKIVTIISLKQACSNTLM